MVNKGGFARSEIESSDPKSVTMHPQTYSSESATQVSEETTGIGEGRLANQPRKRSALKVEGEDEQAGDEQVNDNHRHGGNHDSRSRCPAHALRSSTHAETLVAADSGNN
jgi:hypothetical protein